METLRLLKIQQPSHVQRLLEAFVARGNLLTKGSYQIRNADALPPEPRRVITRAAETGHVWACWADNFYTWLFTCEMSLPMSRERGAPVLQVNLYDEMGELKDAGSWVADREGKWRRSSA